MVRGRGVEGEKIMGCRVRGGGVKKIPVADMLETSPFGNKKRSNLLTLNGVDISSIKIMHMRVYTKKVTVRKSGP